MAVLLPCFLKPQPTCTLRIKCVGLLLVSPIPQVHAYTRAFCNHPHSEIRAITMLQIRERSPLDKVFAYFSSHESEGTKYMEPPDLLHALVPTYPPVESSMERSGNLDGECAAVCGTVGWRLSRSLRVFRVFGFLGGAKCVGTAATLITIGSHNNHGVWLYHRRAQVRRQACSQ